MVDSPHHPEEEVIFALGEAGVMDPEEAEKKTKKTAKKETKKTTKKSASKEKIETPIVETPEITNTKGQELTTVETPETTNPEDQEVTTVETPETTNPEDQEVTTVETPEVLALSEALDEEFSDSAPTDV
jgi:DNA repair protein RadA